MSLSTFKHADVLSRLHYTQDKNIYLVGGVVRDALLYKSARDLDVVVEGDALMLGRELARETEGIFVLLDQDRASGRVHLPNNSGTIDFCSLKGEIGSDLAKRDFTIDAMALKLEDASRSNWEDYIQDPYGGRPDIVSKRVRQIHHNVFQDDPIRLLRGCRLSTWLGFEIEGATKAQITSDAAWIKRVSVERTRDELLSMLSANGSKTVLRLLDEVGLLCHIIPELTETKGVSQPKEHYWEVFDHIIEAVGAVEMVTSTRNITDSSTSIYWDDDLETYFSALLCDGHDRRTWLKVGALFHDIAKPQTKSIDETGRTRFIGHSDKGAEIAEYRLKSLRVGHKAVNAVATMVKNHLRPSMMSYDSQYPTARAVYRFYRDLEESSVSVLFLSLADYVAARGPRLESVGWKKKVKIVNYVLNQKCLGQQPRNKTRLITGHDLISELGLTPGPAFRNLLDGVEEACRVQEVINRDEALYWLRSKLKEMKA